MMDRGPIFVAGLERSGTSLIYALLASHPGIAMTRRTNMWTYFYEQFGDLSQQDNFERCLALMMRYKRLVKLQPDPDRIRAEFKQGSATYARLFALLETHYAEKVGKSRWGDKSLNTERYADPIFAAYPGARMLHMIRDPRDRYASVQTRWQIRRGGVGAGTGMWLSSIQLAKRHRQAYPTQYMIVRYETLASQPEETLRKICEFIDEPYAAEMLTMRGAGSFRDQGGNSSYGTREAGVISTRSIGRFRKVLSAGQIAFIQEQAGPEMKEFDYEPVPVHFTRQERLLFSIAGRPLDLVRMYAWQGRNRIRNRTGRKLPQYRIVPGPGMS